MSRLVSKRVLSLPQLFTMMVMAVITVASLTIALDDFDTSKVKAIGGQIDSTPVGTSVEGYWTTAPQGYLLEDGSIYQCSQYPSLCSILGDDFGGDGISTFGVPDSRGLVGVARNPSETEFDTIGETGGEMYHTLTESELPAHDHDFSGQTIHWGAGLGNVYFGQHTEIPDSLVWAVGGAAPSTPANIVHTYNGENGWADTYGTGGGGAHNELQPYVVILRAVRY